MSGGRPELDDRSEVLRRAVPEVRLERVRGVDRREFDGHMMVAMDLGHDRSGRDARARAVAADHRGGGVVDRRVVAIDENMVDRHSEPLDRPTPGEACRGGDAQRVDLA